MSLARSSAPLPNLEWVINRSPLLLSVELDLKQAIAALYQAKAPCALVVATDQTLVGILTERDILRLCVENQNLEGLSLREAMVHPVVSLAETDLTNKADLEDCLARLETPYLPLVDEQGRVTGLIDQPSVSRDIQCISNLEQELNRYQLAEQASEIVIYDYHIVEDKITWSLNFESLLNYPANLFPQTFGDWRNLIHPEDFSAFQVSIDAAFDESKIFDVEYRVRHAAGHYVWIKDRNQFVRDAQGQVIGVVGTISNITRRKENELKLAASEAKLQEAQRLAKIGSWEWNIPDNTEIWSPELYRLLELDPQQFSPSSEAVLAKLPQEEQQKLLDRHQIHLQDKLPYELVYRYPTPDGRQKYIWDRIESVFDDQGQPIRTWGTCQDVTETYRYQAILQQLVDGTASVTGENFFNALVRNLAQALEVEYALVSINQGDRLQTLAWVAHGELQPNMSYPIAQTPCEVVIYQGEYFCDSQLRERFLDDPDLTNLSAETYLGIGLRGETGEIIGHLCVLHTQPWSANLTDNYWQIMRIFAARASVELQRNLANEQLQQFNQSLEAKIAEQTHLLAEIAQFQQAIFDSTDYLIVSTDIDGIIVSANAGAEKLCGYSAADLIGKTTPLIFCDPEGLQKTLNHLSQQLGGNILPGINLFLESVRQTGQLDIEVLIRHRHGHRFPLALTITPLKNQDQIIIGFLGIGRDISQEKLAAQALQESDRRYNNLVAASPVGIFQNNAQGFCIYTNDRCLAMSGLTSESGLGEGWYQTLHPEDRDWVAHAWQQFVDEKRPFNEEYRFVLPDGSITWVMAQAVVDRDDDGKVLGYLGTLTDITQRKQAELERQTAIAKLEEVVHQLQLAQQEIGQSNRLLKTITKAQAQFITAADRLTIFDELLTDLLDLTESEYGFIGEVLFRDDGTAAMDNNLLKIKGVPYVKTHGITNIAWDEETQKFYEENYQEGMEFTNMNTLFGAVVMTGKPVIANNPHTDPRRGGTPKGHPPLNAFLGLPFFRGDTLMGMVGIANRPGGYDEGIIAFLAPFLITCSNLIEGYRGDRQRRQAEAQLQLTNEELLRVTRLKDEFLANMSHELRTPLNAILGNTEILEDELFGPINGQQLTSLHTITKSSHHLLALINDILDVAKIESGQIELNYSSIAIQTLCQTCIAFITPQAQKRKIQLQTHVSPELQTLRGDERRVRQVLINLLNNAVKFTPEGGTISLTVSPQAPKPPNTFPLLRFEITDTGIGITSDNLTKLFRPFIQIDSALNRQYEGTGLGLALVKQIVELHGGEVSVTSKWGEGSCFTVDFPYNPTE